MLCTMCRATCFQGFGQMSANFFLKFIQLKYERFEGEESEWLKERNDFITIYERLIMCVYLLGWKKNSCCVFSDVLQNNKPNSWLFKYNKKACCNLFSRVFFWKMNYTVAILWKRYFIDEFCFCLFFSCSSLFCSSILVFLRIRHSMHTLCRFFVATTWNWNRIEMKVKIVNNGVLAGQEDEDTCGKNE